MMYRLAGAVAALLAAPVAAAPGDLIGSERVAGAPAGATAFRIRYASTGVRGEATTVSGLVIIPRGPPRGRARDVVAWAHGSYGFAQKCAPLPQPALFDTIAGLDALLAAGNVVVASDYQGLGNPGPHPYLAGDATAHAVIDAVRAAQKLPRARTSGRFAVWGESQGGHAALWTGKLARAYAPELQLVGVAAAAPPTDLAANLGGGTNAAVRALLTAFTAESWSKVYGAPLADIGGRGTQRLIGALAQNCVTLDGFRLRTKIGLLRLTAQLKGVDITQPPAWGRLIARNSVTPAGLTMPVLIAQEDKDPVVGSTITRAFAGRLCRRGGTLRYIALPDGSHVEAGKRAAPQAVAWIADRFAGRTAPSDCGRL